MIEADEVETIVGGDKGIKKLLSVSGKTQFSNPQFAKSEERRLAIRQRRVSRKKKGGKNRSKAGAKLAKTHREIRRKREDYQWKVAKQFVSIADANAIEELNVKGMMKRCKPKQDENGKFIENGQAAKSGLSKLITDASWYSLDQKIKHQSNKQGKLCIPVAPNFTSQECSNCHHVDASNRDGEKYICSNCGHVDDADNNAGTNIANKAIGTAQLNKEKVRVVRSEFTPQIRLRRNHQQRLVSLGRRTNQQNKLRQTEKTILNGWVQKYIVESDSLPVALAQGG
jgi:putative transposase